MQLNFNLHMQGKAIGKAIKENAKRGLYTQKDIDQISIELLILENSKKGLNHDKIN